MYDKLPAEMTAKYPTKQDVKSVNTGAGVALFTQYTWMGYIFV